MVGVEQDEERRLVDFRHRLDPGTQRSEPLPAESRAHTPRLDLARALGRNAFDEPERPILLEGLESDESPARAHQQAQLLCRRHTHVRSDVTRSTSS